MALKNKYQREKQQYTYDSGRTWIDVSPANYRRGRLIEAGSEDCNTVEWREVTGSWFCIGFNDTQYRWVTVSGEYVCVGYNKYSIKKKQQSVDGGTTWTDVSPIETRQGDLIEANSADCGYVPPTPGDYENQYLTFEAIEDGTFTFTGTSSHSLSYSLDDGQTWTALASGTASPTVTAGNKIMWKGTCTPSDNGIGKFSSTGTFNAYGNTMSIVHGDNFQNSTTISGNQFSSLFNSTKVVNAENLVLPATTLANYCYYKMFYGCTSLVNAPALPSMTLANWSYGGMFSGCTSLETAPELPATTLADSCYGGMFDGCTSLVTAPTLPATTLAYNCYQYMFKGCTGLVTAPELPATTLADYCYNYMFRGCTSLVNAPTLPATTLADYCYNYMFRGCSSLNYIKCLATDISASNCLTNWVDGVASRGTFVKAANMESWTTGNNGIPTGWTVVTE